MNDDLTALAKKYGPRLADGERASMKASFESFMDEHPVRPPIRSPFFIRGVAYALGLVLVVGAPTMYAAERSLPNDFLYPIKVDVMEPVVLAVASVSPSLEADTRNALLKRRLAEARTLVRSDALEDEASTVLVEHIATHVEAVQDYVEESTASGDLSEALDTGSELESLLDAYGKSLSALASADPNDADDASAKRILSIVNDERKDTEELGEDLEDALVASSTESKEYLEKITEDADTVIAEARERFAKYATSSDPISEEAKRRFTEAEDAYDAAHSSAASGVVDSALAEYRDAFQSATESLILLEAVE